MCLVFHNSTIGAAKRRFKLVNAFISHWHLLVLVDVRLLLRVYAVNSRPGWIHLLLLTLCCLASIGLLEAIHIMFILVFVHILLFHSYFFIKLSIILRKLITMYMHRFSYQLTLVCFRFHWNVEIWCCMEGIIHVHDIWWNFGSWADGVCMQWLLLTLTQSWELRRT